MRNEYKEKITSTADWQINRLKIPGYSSEDIENALKDTLNASYLEMFELYDKVIDWEYVRNKDIYEQINAEYIPFEENKHGITSSSPIEFLNAMIFGTRLGIDLSLIHISEPTRH